MGIFRFAAVLVAIFALSGCAAVALTAGGIAGGSAVDHTLSGISYKTFNSRLVDVRKATLRTLAQMEIALEDDTHTDEGWKITGTAIERKVHVDLEKLTPSATRMRVVVDVGSFFFKDAATGTEIIIQTAENLNRLAAR